MAEASEGGGGHGGARLGQEPLVDPLQHLLLDHLPRGPRRPEEAQEALQPAPGPHRPEEPAPRAGGAREPALEQEGRPRSGGGLLSLGQVHEVPVQVQLPHVHVCRGPRQRANQGGGGREEEEA